jgi:ankyrin repeat protein
MDIEDEIYEAFEHANRFKFGVLTGEKIISAVKANNVLEVKRLINLSVDEGGLLILRFTQQDKNGKTALQIAEEMNYYEIIEVLVGNNGKTP